MIYTLQNTPIELDPNQLAIDQGWDISEGIAYHSGCFSGIITLKNITVEAGKTYSLTYATKTYASGTVYPIVGGVSGTPHSGIDPEITQTFAVPADATDLTVKFYSDGELGISYMNIYPVLAEPINGVTLGFNAQDNAWTTTYSFEPQFMLKFVNDFFSWSQGKLYKHNTNETRNLFYGVQYYSEIEIIMNIQPTAVKNLYSMRVNSNLPWEVTDVLIRPIVGKVNGQRSRIKKGNFVNINGQFFADFLRDSTDPRFGSELEALFSGANLQSTTAKITLRSDDTTEVRLVSIDILGSIQEYSY